MEVKKRHLLGELLAMRCQNKVSWEKKAHFFSKLTLKYHFKKYSPRVSKKLCPLDLSVAGCRRVQCSLRMGWHVAASWPLQALWWSKNRPDVLLRVLSGHAKIWWSCSPSVFSVLVPLLPFSKRECSVLFQSLPLSFFLFLSTLGSCFLKRKVTRWWYVVISFFWFRELFRRSPDACH